MGEDTSFFFTTLNRTDCGEEKFSLWIGNTRDGGLEKPIVVLGRT